ncbi:MAG TPA: MliC family protein [Burkholderiales bacterium]|nr:MliC family protein [Burkholderiales bacterium]
MNRFLLLAATLGLTACGSLNWWSGPTEQSRIPRDATLYQCDGGKKLPIRYDENGKSAMIILPEREFRLDQVDASAGVRYSNGRATLHTNGSDVRLEEGGSFPYDNCKKP